MHLSVLTTLRKLTNAPEIVYNTIMDKCAVGDDGEMVEEDAAGLTEILMRELKIQAEVSESGVTSRECGKFTFN